MRNDVENLFPPQPKLSSRKSDQLMTKDIPILPQLVRSKRPLKRKLVKLEPLTSMPQLPLTATPTPTADMDTTKLPMTPMPQLSLTMRTLAAADMNTVKLPMTPMPQLSLTMRTLAVADMNTVKLPMTPIVFFSDRGVDFAADMNTVKLPLTPLPEVSLAPLLLQLPQTQAQTVGDTPNYSVEQLKVMTPKHEKQYIVLTLI